MRPALAIVLTAALFGTLAAAATAGGGSAPQPANAYCKLNKAVLVGPGKLYRNHGQCLKAQKALAGGAAKNAATACRGELADLSFPATHGGQSFAEHYGTNGANGNGKSQGKSKGKGNAFGKCVSGKARAAKAEGQGDELGAAKLCKSWRAQPNVGQAALGGLSFAQAYGTAPSAFGKCVSAQAKAHGHDTDETRADDDS